MTHWLPTSLTGRLVLAVVVAVVAAQAVAGVILLREQRHVTRHVVRAFTLDRVPGIAQLILPMSPDRRAEILRVLNSSTTRYTLADTPLAETGERDLRFQARLQRAMPPAIVDVRATIRSVPERGRGRYGTPLPDGDVLTLSLHLPDGRWLNIERVLHPPIPEMIWPMALSLGLSAIAVAVAVALAVRRIVRPLATLSDAADRLGRGENVGPLLEEGPADVRRTTHAFNVMSERLTRFVADRTRMLAAIAHDLRTPITGMRLRAEMIDEAETRERMLAGLNDMAEMTEAALTFAQADAQEEDSRRIDLASLVQSICDDFADAGEAVRFQGPDRLDAICRPTALKRAVRNLIVNAVRYGQAAEVTLTHTATAITLTIADDGPGLPEDQLERVFDPFVRLEESRSRETGGSGLGLSIARNIARAHGGDVTLANRPEGGAEARLTLPL
ncbi:ATP-binding protein [Rhodovibrio salinarum]|nr:ATP-binding protein [Rhodovibrio salinarum]